MLCNHRKPTLIQALPNVYISFIECKFIAPFSEFRTFITLQFCYCYTEESWNFTQCELQTDLTEILQALLIHRIRSDNPFT